MLICRAEFCLGAARRPAGLQGRVVFHRHVASAQPQILVNYHCQLGILTAMLKVVCVATFPLSFLLLIIAVPCAGNRW